MIEEILGYSHNMSDIGGKWGIVAKTDKKDKTKVRIAHYEVYPGEEWDGSMRQCQTPLPRNGTDPFKAWQWEDRQPYQLLEVGQPHWREGPFYIPLVSVKVHAAMEAMAKLARENEIGMKKILKEI